MRFIGEYKLIDLIFPKFYSFNFDFTAGVDKIYKNAQDLNTKYKNDGEEINNIRIVLEGSKDEIKSFNQIPLKNLGIRIDSKIGNKEIGKEDIQELKLTSGKIAEFFNEFLYREGIKEDDKEIGLHYFNKIN